MLLNIDKPHGTATLHTSDCAHIPQPVGTQHKPIDAMGRDGGWFTVADQAQGQDVAATQWPRATFVRCQYC